MKKLLEEIKDKLQELVKDEGTVMLKEVQKNNILLHGITIKKADDIICSIAYVDSYLEDLKNGWISLDFVAQQLLETLKEAPCPDIILDLKRYNNVEYLREHVQYQLISIEGNEEFLKDLIYREIQGLAVIYRVMLGKQASYLVSQTMQKKFGFSFEDLDSWAHQNGKENGYRLENMMDIIGDVELVGCVSEKDMKNMMILRTNSLEYGAAVVLFPEFLKEVAETIQEDLILLPSSIHEWIVFPKKQFEYDSDLDHLKEVVGEVNNTLQKQEILSYHVFYYDRTAEKFLCVR